MLGFVLVLQIPAVKAAYCLWQDTDTYKQYVDDYTITMVIKNGNYKIHAGKNVEFVLAEGKEEDTGEKKGDFGRSRCVWKKEYFHPKW